MIVVNVLVLQKKQHTEFLVVDDNCCKSTPQEGGAEALIEWLKSSTKFLRMLLRATFLASDVHHVTKI